MTGINQGFEKKCQTVLALLQQGPQKSNELFRSVPEYKTCISLLRGQGHRIKAEKSGYVILYSWNGFVSVSAEHGQLVLDFNAEFHGRAQGVALTPDESDQWIFFLQIPDMQPLKFEAPTLEAAVDMARRFLIDPQFFPAPPAFHVEHRSNEAHHSNQ